MKIIIESFISDFEGIINFIDRKYSETERWWVQYELEKYLSERDCEVCNGFRLNKKALAVKIANHHIGEITKKSIDECFDWFNKLKQNLSPNENKIAEGVNKRNKDRLEFLNRVGLDYLSLSRASKSLSGWRESKNKISKSNWLRINRGFICS